MALPFLDLVFGPPDDPAGNAGASSRRNNHRDESVARERPADPDAHLTLRLKAGDPAGIDGIVERYYQALVGFAESILHDGASGEDVVQETLVAIWDRRDAITIHTTLAAYLFTAVRHAALNARRSLLTRRRITAEQAADVVNTVPPPDAPIEADEREALINQAVAGLAPRYREVLMLRVAGLTYEAIGDILSLPSATVRTRGVRGIAMLRAALEKKL